MRLFRATGALAGRGIGFSHNMGPGFEQALEGMVVSGSGGIRGFGLKGLPGFNNFPPFPKAVCALKWPDP